MNYKTLLEQRQAELNDLIDTVLVRAEMLRKCVEGKHSDVNNHVRDLARAAEDARLIAAKVDDLHDVEKYGSRGGR
jgi:hypothetical protein